MYLRAAYKQCRSPTIGLLMFSILEEILRALLFGKYIAKDIVDIDG
jgi:hypothetical protein